MFKFIKSIFSENTHINLNQNQKNVGEKNYKQSDSLLFIYNYDEKIADFIEYSDIPKYAIDWLAESIKNGVSIQISAIYDSITKGLPYLCETDEEVWLFNKDENPLRNSPVGIHNILISYTYGSYKNKNKFNYWVNRLVSLANNGDRMAQGLLCWQSGMILENGEYNGYLSQSIWENYKECYEDALLKDCNNGDPYCQLSVANNYRKIDDKTKEELFISAINNRLTDACYYYAQFLVLKRYEENDFHVHIPPYGTEDWQEYMRVELSLYKMGAEFNNGVMAGYCQYRLAEMYDCGDGGVLKDEAMAQIWYKKSFENGFEHAKCYIKV